MRIPSPLSLSLSLNGARDESMRPKNTCLAIQAREVETSRCDDKGKTQKLEKRRDKIQMRMEDGGRGRYSRSDPRQKATAVPQAPSFTKPLS